MAALSVDILKVAGSRVSSRRRCSGREMLIASIEGSEATEQAQHASRMASERTTCVRPFPIIDTS